MRPLDNEAFSAYFYSWWLDRIWYLRETRGSAIRDRKWMSRTQIGMAAINLFRCQLS